MGENPMFSKTFFIYKKQRHLVCHQNEGFDKNDILGDSF